MKMSIERKVFAGALELAAAVAPTRGVRPSLRNCMMTAAPDGAVEIMATDMEVGLRVRVQAKEIVDAESACWPAAMLSNLLKEYAEEQVNFETHGLKGTVSIGSDRFQILGLGVDDFPDVLALNEGPNVTAAG